MLACEPRTTNVLYSGKLRWRSVLHCVVVVLLVLLQDPVFCDEEQCSRSTFREHLRKSFKIIKLGRTRNVRSCINLCCSSKHCDLALLRKSRCYGISCSHHDLCRGIMKELRMKRHEISKRSTLDTAEDVPSDFTHHARDHGFCHHRRVVPHHVFLQGGRGISIFRKLATGVRSSHECNQYCCERSGCSLAFIMREKCYGVICPDDRDCESSRETRVPLHLEIAFVQRRALISETNGLRDPGINQESFVETGKRHHHYYNRQETAENTERELRRKQAKSQHQKSHRHRHKNMGHTKLKRNKHHRHINHHVARDFHEKEDTSEEENEDRRITNKGRDHYKHLGAKLSLRNDDATDNDNEEENEDDVTAGKFAKMDVSESTDRKDVSIKEKRRKHLHRKAKRRHKDKKQTRRKKKERHAKHVDNDADKSMNDKDLAGLGKELKDEDDDNVNDERSENSEQQEVENEAESRKGDFHFGKKDSSDALGSRGEDDEGERGKKETDGDSQSDSFYQEEKNENDDDDDDEEQQKYIEEDNENRKSRYEGTEKNNEVEHRNDQDKNDKDDHLEKKQMKIQNEMNHEMNIDEKEHDYDGNKKQDFIKRGNENWKRRHKSKKRYKEVEHHNDQGYSNTDDHFESKPKEARNEMNDEMNNDRKEQNHDDDEQQDIIEEGNENREKWHESKGQNHHNEEINNEYNHLQSKQMKFQNDEEEKGATNKRKVNFIRHHHQDNKDHNENYENEKQSETMNRSMNKMNKEDDESNEGKTKANNRGRISQMEHHKKTKKTKQHYSEIDQRSSIQYIMPLDHNDRTETQPKRLSKFQKRRHKHTLKKYHYDSDENKSGDYDYSHDEHYDSSEKINVLEDGFENKRSKKKEKLQGKRRKKSDSMASENDNRDDKEGEGTSINHEMTSRESKSKLIHSNGKDEENEETYENNKENKARRIKFKEGTNKRREGEENQDYDIHDKEDSDRMDGEEKSRSKVDVSDASSDTYNNFKGNMNRDKTHRKRIHKSRKISDGRKDGKSGSNNDNDSKEMSKNHVNSNNDKHGEKKHTKDNFNAKYDEREGRTSEGKFETEGSSENAGHENQDSTVNEDSNDKNRQHHYQNDMLNEQKLKGEISGHKSSRQQHESVENRELDYDHNEDVKHRGLKKHNFDNDKAFDVDNDNHRNSHHYTNRIHGEHNHKTDSQDEDGNHNSQTHDDNNHDDQNNNDDSNHDHYSNNDDNDIDNSRSNDNHKQDSSRNAGNPDTYRQDNHDVIYDDDNKKNRNLNDHNEDDNHENTSQNENHHNHHIHDDSREISDNENDHLNPIEQNEYKDERKYHVKQYQKGNANHQSDNEKQEKDDENESKNTKHFKNDENGRPDNYIHKDGKSSNAHYEHHKGRGILENGQMDKLNNEQVVKESRNIARSDNNIQNHEKNSDNGINSSKHQNNDENINRWNRSKSKSRESNQRENQSANSGEGEEYESRRKANSKDEKRIQLDHRKHNNEDYMRKNNKNEFKDTQRKYESGQEDRKDKERESHGNGYGENNSKSNNDKDNEDSGEVEEKNKAEMMNRKGSESREVESKDKMADNRDKHEKEQEKNKNSVNNYDGEFEGDEFKDSDSNEARRDHTENTASSDIAQKRGMNKVGNVAETSDENKTGYPENKNDNKNREGIEDTRHMSEEIKGGNNITHRNTGNRETITKSPGNATERKIGSVHKYQESNKSNNNIHELTAVKNQTIDEEKPEFNKYHASNNHKNRIHKNRGNIVPYEYEKGIDEKGEKQKQKVQGLHNENSQKNIMETSMNNRQSVLQNQNNSQPTIKENANIKNIEDVIETPIEKHNNKKAHSSEIQNIMTNNEQTNATYPKHKQSLYHTLKDLKEMNDTSKLISKADHLPTVHNEQDIMKINQNYTFKSDLRGQTLEGDGEEKTKYFDQETNEWKESYKGDSVDESGKFFNQRTRDWSTKHPKTETEYFHNLTSQWDLSNKTKSSGKYFNQRTETWLRDKVGNTHQNLSDIHVLGDKSHTLSTFGSMKGKSGDTRKIASNAKDNTKKLKQNILLHNKHQQKHKAFIPNGKSIIRFSPKLIHNNTKVRDPFHHLKTSSSRTVKTHKPLRAKIVKNVAQGVTNNIKESESAEEKVKNEILKLIGETPIKKVTPQKKVKSGDSSLITKGGKFPKPNQFSKTGKPKTKPAIIVQSPENIHSTRPQHQSRIYKTFTFKHNEMLNEKSPPRRLKTLKTKDAFKIKRPYDNLTISLPPKRNPVYFSRKQMIPRLPKQPIQQTRPNQPPTVSIRRLKLPNPQSRHVPNVNINPANPKTLPGVHTWTTWNAIYSPTKGSIQNWNSHNIFDNEWKNAKWNSYYPYGSNSITPTAKPTLPWNNMDGWNSNRNSQTNSDYPKIAIESQSAGFSPTVSRINRGNIQGIKPANSPITRGQLQGIGPTNSPMSGKFSSSINAVKRPAPAPQYKQTGFPLNKNGALNNIAQNGENEVSLIQPTLLPKYTQNGFPFAKNGDAKKTEKGYWNQNSKTPTRAQSPQVRIKAISHSTPTRNYVYKYDNVEEHRIPPFKQPGKPASSQKTNPHILSKPLINLTRSTPPKKAALKQPLPSRNNHTKDIQLRNLSKPKEQQDRRLKAPLDVRFWNETSTTGEIEQPFQVEKIEALHSEATKKEIHPKVPKGCYPGEIMSEMTLESGLDAGNYTKLGQSELMDSCISKCCEMRNCEIAIQMDNICFGLQCYSKESCKIKTTLGKSSHHKICFISRKKKERQSILDFDNDILGEQDVCHQEEAIGLNWKTTNAGKFDQIPCPKKAKGVARRKCSVESHWLVPDFSSCVSNDYENLYQRAKRLIYGEDSSSLLQSLAMVTTRTIDNSLMFGGDLKKTTEIITSIVQEQGTKENEEISQKDVQNYLITCSNALDDSNKQEWRNVQKDARGSADILRDSQTFALIASSKLPATQTNVTYITNNIVVQMKYEEKGSNDKTYPDYTNTDVAMWDGEKDNIKIPASVFSIGDIKAVTFSYKTLPGLLPMNSNEHFSHSEPNSKILATIVEPRIQDKITPPITVTLHHLKRNRINAKCVFWDFNLNPTHGGGWSTEGCWVESSTKEHTVCRCNHLANFAVLMDVIDTSSMQESEKEVRYSKEMAALWICVPVLVVLIIGALYTASTWSLRGPRRRTLNEKSSLLRSAITTDEVRYDYSTTPNHNLKGATTPSSGSTLLKKLEWKTVFDKYVQSTRLDMEHDSGIESNDHDDSNCDLSLNQDIESPQSKTISDYAASTLSDDNNTSIQHLDMDHAVENEIIHLHTERRIFSSNLRRCCATEDLSFSHKIK